MMPPGDMHAAARAAPPRQEKALEPLIGRDSELRRIASLLDRHTLVTLVAPGGMGKSALAAAAMRHPASSFPDGTWHVDLATAYDAEAAQSMLAGLFHLESRGFGSPIDAVLAWLEPRRSLIVLDNCEHLDLVAGFADRLAARGSPARVLATRRRAFGAAGEAVVDVPPLALPTSDEPDDAAHAPAVALFLDRAARIPGGLEAARDAAPAVARLCRRLNGIPLALVWAAAKLQLFTPDQLVARIDRHFARIEAEGADLSDSETVLRSLFAWSYDLLPDREKKVLRRLGLIPAGWSPDAATAVVGDAGPAEDVLRAVAVLAAQSLVTPVEGDATRYRLPTAARPEAISRLRQAETAQERDAFLRYVDYLTGVVREAEAAWSTTPTLAWRERYAPELDNVRSVLAWAFDAGGDAERGLRLLAHTALFWWDLSLQSEGRRWFDIALTHVSPRTPPDIAGRLWIGQSLDDAAYLGDVSSTDLAQRAVDLLERDEGDFMLVMALWSHAIASGNGARPGVARASVARMRALMPPGPSRTVCLCLNLEAWFAVQDGDAARARRIYEEALGVAQAIGDLRALSGLLSNIAELDHIEGQVEQATDGLRAAIAQTRRLGLPNILALQLCNLAGYFVALGHDAQARPVALEAMEMAHGLGLASVFAFAAEHWALATARLGDAGLAAQFAGFASAQEKRRPMYRTETEAGTLRALRMVLEQAVPAERLAELHRQGAGWARERMLAEARRHGRPVPKVAAEA